MGKRILFVANNETAEVTGGTRIWLELAKRWKDTVVVEGSPEAQQHLFNDVGVCFFHQTCPPMKHDKMNNWQLAWHSISRTFYGIKAITHADADYIYSVSDFLPDVIPCWLYKMKFPTVKWLAGYYLVASPKPYKGGHGKVRGILYWLLQRVTLFLVNHFADYVLVTSEPDRIHFPNKNVVVVRGGVDLSKVKIDTSVKKIYDAVFMGRFHYQKGVIELIDIWEQVVEILPTAKLAMIGDGELYDEVVKRIKQKNLNLNIEVLGVLQGQEKLEIFKRSKIVVHPATYDSGGFSCAEAMAWGLPAVGFDLPAFKTYYPKGMLKCRLHTDFVNNIILLLEDKVLYKFHRQQALDLVYENFDWEKQAQRVYDSIF